jgi:hypothetical protein
MQIYKFITFYIIILVCFVVLVFQIPALNAEWGGPLDFPEEPAPAFIEENRDRRVNRTEPKIPKPYHTLTMYYGDEVEVLEFDPGKIPPVIEAGCVGYYIGENNDYVSFSGTFFLKTVYK